LGKGSSFPARSRGREKRGGGREERRKEGGGGGAHSLSHTPHAPVLVHQHAPSCVACVMRARLVRMWGPSIRRRPPRPSAAGPTNRPRPAEHAPPGTKAASDSGRDRGLQFPRPWGSRNTITRGRHRCLRGPPSHPPTHREGGGRRRENLGRFIYGQEGKGGGRGEKTRAHRRRPPPLLPPSLSTRARSPLRCGSAVIEWIIASTYGVCSPRGQAPRLAHLIVDRHSRGGGGGGRAGEREGEGEGRRRRRRVRRGGRQGKTRAHANTTHTHTGPQIQPFDLVRRVRANEARTRSRTVIP